jgi:ribonuclease HII
MTKMIGLDEAGVGPAFGNLIACALHMPDAVSLPKLTDSKKLTPRMRDELYESITETCLFGIGTVTNSEIDTGGLGEARRLVFERALEDFERKYPDFQMTDMIVDGQIFRPWKSIPHQCMNKADLCIPAVSAASVIAKVTRDRQVIALCDLERELDSQYDLRKNKGYLTQKHIEGIRKHGRSKHHRMSYKIKL